MKMDPGRKKWALGLAAVALVAVVIAVVVVITGEGGDEDDDSYLFKHYYDNQRDGYRELYNERHKVYAVNETVDPRTLVEVTRSFASRLM